MTGPAVAAAAAKNVHAIYECSCCKCFTTYKVEGRSTLCTPRISTPAKTRRSTAVALPAQVRTVTLTRSPSTLHHSSHFTLTHLNLAPDLRAIASPVPLPSAAAASRRTNEAPQRGLGWGHRSLPKSSRLVLDGLDEGSVDGADEGSDEGSGGGSGYSADVISSSRHLVISSSRHDVMTSSRHDVISS